MQTIPSAEPARTYSQQAAALDARLDKRLAYIRGDLDRGEITPAEAGAERIKILEEHLSAIRQLRIDYFGDSQ